MHLVQRSTSLRIPSTKKVFDWSRNHLCNAWISSSLAIPGVSTPYSVFWILAHSDGPTFHLLWLFCSKILLCLYCCSGRVSVGRSHTHFYAVEHCSRIVLKASDEFQPLTHLPTSALCFSLVHTASGATMFTLSQQQGKWRYQGQTSITRPQ
jgi:hypothetical protein